MMKRLACCVVACAALISVLILGGCGSSGGFSLTFPGGTALAIDEGQSVTVTVTVANDSSNEGVTWACTGAACTTLASVTATSVTFNATGATGTATITATSVKDTTKSKSVTITVSADPTITTTQAQLSGTAAVAGQSYNFSFIATGGSGTLTWSATGLSDGLSINSSTGAVTGTPTAHGTVTFTVTVKDSSSAGAESFTTAALTITVSNPPAPTITTTQAQVTAAPATAGSMYGFTFHASGTGTLTWSATGLSDGLSLNTSTGAVSGTPTSAAAVNIMLTVSDTYGQSSAATPFTITVNNPPAPVITTTQAQVTAATVGTLYSFRFSATGTGTLTWSATGLSDGLSLNTSNGTVSGTPTTHTTVPFTLTVSDTFGQSSAATPFTITVNNPAPPQITTTPAQVPSATLNAAYSFTLQGSGYGTLTWSTTPALSDGLSINPATGQITGTPTTATTLNFSVTLTDGLGQQTTVNGFSIVVSTESIAFTGTVPTSMTESGSFSINATVSGDTGNGGVDWTVTCGSSPCGSFTSTHTASGTATTFDAPATVPSGGTVTITATAHDAPNPQVSAVVTVNFQTLTITTSSLPSGTVNTSYNATITASGGEPPYTFSLDSGSAALPAGLSFTPGSPSATISGTPTATGTTSGIKIDVKDSETTPMTTQMTYSITINSVNAACGSGSESLLSGHYTFLLKGFTGTGAGTPTIIATGFTANGTGGITGGDEDINTYNSANHYTISSTSTYSVGSDHRGCMTIVNSNNATSVFRFNLGGISSGVASKGWVIEFDETSGAGTHVTGPMRQQDSTSFSLSKLKSNYAFGMDGWDTNNSTLNHFGIIGSFTINTSGTISNGFSDANDGGQVFSGLTGSTGTLSAISTSTGRATGTYILPNGGNPLTFDYAVYMISASEYFIVSTDTDSSVPVSSGRGIATGTSFGLSTLSGNYIVHATGFDPNPGAASVILAQANLDNGTLTGTSYDYEDNGNGLQSESLAGQTYTVGSSSGRIAVSQSGQVGAILYITTPTDGISAFFMDTGSSVEAGLAEAQPNQTYSISSLASSDGGVFFFGNEDPGDNTVQNELDQATLSSNGGASVTQDEDNPGATPPLQADQTMVQGAGFLTMGSNGIGTVNSGGAGGILMTNGSRIFGIFNTTDTAEMEVGDQ
jgi:large repetitive protein